MRFGGRSRVAVTVLGVLLALAALAVVGYRVLAPRDTLTRPTVPYPEPSVITDERPFGELRAAPLIVERRLRVFAEKWRVWSDFPVGERYESTPYWVLRRWPAQVVGVAAVQTPAGPRVVSQWSDGAVITLDARGGTVAWRVDVPIVAHRYDGRRTGAAVVYEPALMRTVRVGERVVVVVVGRDALQAYDADTGRLLWRRATACRTNAWTGSGLLLVPACGGGPITVLRAVDGRPVRRWTPPPASGQDAPTTPAVPAVGRPAPALCAVGRAECPVVTASGRAWRLHPDARFEEVPPLPPGALPAGALAARVGTGDEFVVYPTRTGVAARRLAEAAPRWRWDGQARLFGADAAGVYLLTDDRTVLGLDPGSGRLIVLGCAASPEDETWRVGHVYATGIGYVAIERVTGAPPESADQRYYFGPRPVALVELYAPTKLPVWPGKFAACAPS
jgi:outer membrane protein assembly factor BamB